MKFYTLAIILTSALFSTWIGLRAQTPASPNTKGKQKTAQKGPQKKGPATPVKPDPPPAIKPLTLLEVADLLTVSAMPDAACARVVSAAPLPLPPEEDWVQALTRIRSRAERPACYDALFTRIPPGPSVADVEKAAPGLLEQIRMLVQSGKKDELVPFLRPEVVKEDSSVFDRFGKTYPQIGNFFAMFETGRYQKHQFGRFIEFPGRKVGVPVYILTNDIIENFYFVVFTRSQDKLIVREIVKGREIAEFALTAEKNWAIDKVRDLFRDLNQGSLATAKAISTPGLFADLEKIGGWKRFKRGQRLEVEKIAVVSSVPLDGKSVRVVSRVSFPVEGGQMVFDVHFERVGAELRAIGIRDIKGLDIGADKELDCFIVKRYNVTAPCSDYKPTSTENPWFYSFEKLVDYSRRAVERTKPDDIEIYAKELKTILDTDDLRGVPIGLDASAKFLRGNYEQFYQLGKDAIEKGGEVYVPLVRRYATDVAAGGGMRPIILGLSVNGIRYIPSYNDSGKEQILVPPASLKKVKILTDRPAIEIELAGLAEKDWKLFVPGSICAAPGAKPPASGTPLQAIRFGPLSKASPCQLSLIPGPLGDRLGSKNPPSTFYAPANWQEMIKTFSDIHGVLAKVWAAAPAKK